MSQNDYLLPLSSTELFVEFWLHIITVINKDTALLICLNKKTLPFLCTYLQCKPKAVMSIVLSGGIFFNEPD